jgi:hypothetical protein
LGFVVIAAPAGAQDVVFDQSYTPPEIRGTWSIELLDPVGQEFVPQQPRLDIVELFVDHTDSIEPVAASLCVRLRTGTMAGPVAATSDTVAVEFDTFAPVRFTFVPAVETGVGSTWVVELVSTGAGNPAIGGGPDVDEYAPGRGIVGGSFLLRADMWFRTGLRPTAVTAATWGGIKSLFR